MAQRALLLAPSERERRSRATHSGSRESDVQCIFHLIRLTLCHGEPWTTHTAYGSLSLALHECAACRTHIYSLASAAHTHTLFDLYDNTSGARMGGVGRAAQLSLCATQNKLPPAILCVLQTRRTAVRCTICILLGAPTREAEFICVFHLPVSYPQNLAGCSNLLRRADRLFVSSRRQQYFGRNLAICKFSDVNVKWTLKAGSEGREFLWLNL